jgi:hypothetical protein
MTSLAALSPRWSDSRALDALRVLLTHQGGCNDIEEETPRRSALFDAIDADHDRQISPEELQAFVSHTGLALTPADVAAVIALGDSNGDGQINCTEFSHLAEIWTEIDSLRAELAGDLPRRPAVGDSRTAGPLSTEGRRDHHPDPRHPQRPAECTRAMGCTCLLCDAAAAELADADADATGEPQGLLLSPTAVAGAPQEPGEPAALKQGYVALEGHGSKDVWAVLGPGALEYFGQRPRKGEPPDAPLRSLPLGRIDAAGVAADGRGFWVDTRAAQRWVFRTGSAARSASCSVVLSLCTTAHPLCIIFTSIFGASNSEAIMRPNPRSTAWAKAVAAAAGCGFIPREFGAVQCSEEFGAVQCSDVWGSSVQ